MMIVKRIPSIGNFFLFVSTGNYTCHCTNIHGTANWTISVEGDGLLKWWQCLSNLNEKKNEYLYYIGIALDPVQQKRMAHSSWSGDEHQEEDEQEDEEMDEDPTTTTTTVLPVQQTTTTESTTRKTIEANYQLTEEPTKRNNNGPLVREDHQSEQKNKRKASSAMPSKASTSSQGISCTNSRTSHHLFLLLFAIFILIDNLWPALPASWWAALYDFEKLYEFFFYLWWWFFVPACK